MYIFFKSTIIVQYLFNIGVLALPFCLLKDMSAAPKRRCVGNSMTRGYVRLAPPDFRPGEFVKWKDARGRRYESCVLQCDAECVKVVSYNCVVNVLSAGERDTLYPSRWRRRVKVGDVLDVYLANVWQPSLVREIIPASGDQLSICVVEPAFLGSTKQICLKSLRLRIQNNTNDEESWKSLKDTGFAFDSTYPAPFSQTEMKRCRLNTVDEIGWVVRPPCLLPERLQMVRMKGGNLIFCFEDDLTECPQTLPVSSLVPSVPFERQHVGNIDVTFSSDIPMDQSDLCKHHMNHGDAEYAAASLYSLAYSYTNQPKLAMALIKACCKDSLERPKSCHPITQEIWQHLYASRATFAIADLSSLAESLEDITDSLYLSVNTDNVDFVRAVHHLKMRVSVWSMYHEFWCKARKIQTAEESVFPLSATLRSFHDSKATFSVDVVYSDVSMHQNDTSIALDHTAVILDAFSPLSPNREVFGAPSPDYQEQIVQLCGQPFRSRIVDLMFEREKEEYSATLRQCLQRKIVCADNTTVEWNAFEGVCKPEDPDAVTPLVNRRGGVLYHENSLNKIQTVASFLKRDFSDVSGPVDKGSTLLMTSPAQIHDWQRRLAAQGIQSHIFHGTGRRGPAAVEALRRGELILVSFRALMTWEDKTFFQTAPIPLWRLIVDEFETKHPSECFIDGIMSVSVDRTWFLCSKCNKQTISLMAGFLNVRPLASRSGWLRDLTVEASERRFASELFHRFKTSPVRKDILCALFRAMFLCHKISSVPKLSNFSAYVGDSNSYHIPTTFTDAHIKTLKALGKKALAMCRQMLAHPTAGMCMSKPASIWRWIIMAFLGVKPPLHVLSDFIANGKYQLSVEKHLETLRQSIEEGQNVSQTKRALDGLKKLVKDRKSVEINCPICMERVNDGNGISGCFVMGRCGHFLCGDCSENIFKTAKSNSSSSNDYGPTSLVNRPFCPFCRDPWDEKNSRPLILPPKTTDVLKLQRRRLYLLPPENNSSWGKSNPILLTLKRLLISIETEERSASFKPKIVVGCPSSEVAQYIYDCFREDDLHLKHVRRKRKQDRKPRHVSSVRITSKATLTARGEALRLFQSEISETNRLIIPVNLIKGLVFDHAVHFVVISRLSNTEKNIIMRAMRDASYAHGGKIKIHVLQMPNLFGATVNHENIIPTMPRTCGGYISMLESIFKACV